MKLFAILLVLVSVAIIHCKANPDPRIRFNPEDPNLTPRYPYWNLPRPHPHPWHRPKNVTDALIEHGVLPHHAKDQHFKTAYKPKFKLPPNGHKHNSNTTDALIRLSILPHHIPSHPRRYQAYTIPAPPKKQHSSGSATRTPDVVEKHKSDALISAQILPARNDGLIKSDMSIKRHRFHNAGAPIVLFS